jgi:hypothetical protein
MSQELQPTGETQDIRELLQSKQYELDHVLADISEEVAMWNLLFDDMHRSNSGGSPEEQAKVRQEAVKGLDQKWPFHGDFIHVIGRWYVPEVDIERYGMRLPMHEADAFNIVRSNGFSVYEKDGNAPTIGLSFKVGDLSIMSAPIQGAMDVLTYADLNEVSLTYSHPNVRKESLTNGELLKERLVYYDILLRMHYHDSNSEFYRKTALQQKRFLYNVIDTISDVLPSPEFGEKAECEEVIAPYVYRRVTTPNGQKWQKIVSSDNEPIMIAGRIDGVGILESSELDNGTPLRGKSELVDAEAGICLVIEVDQCSIPHTFTNEPVYVPLRMAQKMRLALP